MPSSEKIVEKNFTELKTSVARLAREIDSLEGSIEK